MYGAGGSCCSVVVRWVTSLEVAVYFDAVMSRVSNEHLSLVVDGQTLWSVKRITTCVDEREEGATAVEHLQIEHNSS